MKPTSEQIKWFWKQCGLHHNEPTGGFFWDSNDNLVFDMHKGEDGIDLNNLIKYVVPKLYTCELSKYGRPDDYGLWFAYVRLTDRLGKAVQTNDLDPADALFWACFKALGGKE